ncbi:hypothetical protein NQ317_011826 [Molorchus minor]|uniref:Peptidase M13 N-terminal domain-containing protein n=1 Tax=Molorchus minor TaxID=1323400 RepID=A0ABQ9JFN8_9CUCU|nr:hypothetical protein NQ317_011826 [Molorchus minor]
MPELTSEKDNSRKWWLVWVILVILIIVIGTFVGAYYIYHLNFNGTDGVCFSTDCLQSTIEIRSSIDETQDPCVDFYQFTCGNFIANAYKNNNPSPYFAQVNRNVDKFKAIISEPIRGDESTPVLLQKRFYQACMNETAIDEDENNTFEDLIEQLGGWPLLKGSKWPENTTTLAGFLTKCKELGLPFQWLFRVEHQHDWGQLFR